MSNKLTTKLCFLILAVWLALMTSCTVNHYYIIRPTPDELTQDLQDSCLNHAVINYPGTSVVLK